MSSENKAVVDQDLSLRWVKPPRQERSRDTHDRLIEAAERLLSRGRSWSEISVAELVKEAGASVGAFYNRFRDKDALLHVLQIELNQEGEATAAQAASIGGATAIPFDALIRAFVSLAVSSYRAQYGLRRALLVEMCHQQVFRERAIELARTTCDGLTMVLAARYPDRDPQTLRTVVEVAHRIVYGLLDQNLMFNDRAVSRVIDDATLVEELTTAVRVYIEHRVTTAS